MKGAIVVAIIVFFIGWGVGASCSKDAQRDRAIVELCQVVAERPEELPYLTVHLLPICEEVW